MLWLSLVPLIFSLASSAVGLEAKQTVARLEAVYGRARTLQATFLETYSENGRIVRSESGTAYFRRPGRMRWQYEFPEKNLFVVDGKTAWFYVPADHTATRVPAKHSADWRTPFALLAGEAKLSRVCARVSLAKSVRSESDSDVLLDCAPRGVTPEPADAHGHTNHAANTDNAAEQRQTSSESEMIFFEIVRDTGQLVRVVIRQSGGLEMEFRFQNWRIDPRLPDSFFRFEPPSGVAIVDGELPELPR